MGLAIKEKQKKDRWRIPLVLPVFLRGCRAKKELKRKQIANGLACCESEAQAKSTKFNCGSSLVWRNSKAKEKSKGI